VLACVIAALLATAALTVLNSSFARDNQPVYEGF
jgi:hypothetical protein